MDHNLLAA